MKKSFNPKKLFSLPRDSKELSAWIIKRLFFAMGGGSILGFLAIFVLAGSVLCFFIGDFTGGGGGTVDKNGDIHLDPETKAKNHVLQIAYQSAADDSWQKGLTSDQIRQVSEVNAGLPGIVPMALESMDDSFKVDNSQAFSQALKPILTWKTFTVTTTTYQTINTTDSKQNTKGKVDDLRNTVANTSCKVTTTTKQVQELISANLWDGTITNTYTMQTTGTPSCPKNAGSNTVITQPVLSNTNKVENWSRVWALLKKYPMNPKDPKSYIGNTQQNQEMIASLIATQDVTVNDSTVQRMATELLFGNTSIGALPTGTVTISAPDSTDTLQNVSRYKTYIEEYSKEFQVPPVIVAAIMGHESRGYQMDPSRPTVVLHSGTDTHPIAWGIMQVTTQTAEGRLIDGHVIAMNDNGADALKYLSCDRTNIEIGAQYLGELYSKYNGNLAHMFGAYDAGIGGEDSALGQGLDYPQNTETINFIPSMLNEWIPLMTPVFGSPVLQS